MSSAKRVLLIAIAGAFVAGQAFAHAHLKSAAPAPDSVVKTAPTELDLIFSEGINLKFSGVKVTGPNGVVVKVGAAMLMDEDKTMMAPLADPLAPGAYKVEWHALASDGHKSKGEFGFTVRP